MEKVSLTTGPSDGGPTAGPLPGVEAATISELPVFVIEPGSRRGLRLTEIWQYRELLYFLFLRDLKIRYKQTLLGAAWAILQPLLTATVFTIVLGRLAKVDSDGLPYSLFVFAGLMPWQIFSFSLSQSSLSLVANQQLVSKVYFPRIIVPASSTLVSLVDFLASSPVLIVLMIYYRVPPSPRLLLVVPLVLLAVAAALSIGILLSAVSVRYRDVRYAVPFMIQLFMFSTPVMYPASYVPEKWRILYGLNPMAGVVEAFRWMLFGSSSFTAASFLVSLASIAIMLYVGVRYFRHVERTFADLI